MKFSKVLLLKKCENGTKHLRFSYTCMTCVSGPEALISNMMLVLPVNMDFLQFLHPDLRWSEIISSL